MKILYHHRIASKDGQYVHVEEITKALKAMGHEIIMVGPASVETDSFGSEGGIVSILKRYIPKFAYELMEFFYAFYAYYKLKRAIVEHKPDVMYERYNLYMPAGIWIKKKFNLPMLLEVNAPLFDERSKFGGIAIPWLARWTENYTWRNADYALPVTQVLADRVRQAGVADDKLIVIPNGIDLEKFSNSLSDDEAKEKLGLSGKLVLGFTGFMREWHGLERVLELLSSDSAQERHLLLVGDGPARKSIEKRADELGVKDNLTITGIVGRDSISRYVAAFDVALQPDVVDYASPLKLFEYMIMARAIVAPDMANIREVLADHENALLFEKGNINALFVAVEELCEDEDLRQKISDGARETVFNRKYTWKNNAERIVSLFENMSA